MQPYRRQLLNRKRSIRVTEKSIPDRPVSVDPACVTPIVKLDIGTHIEFTVALPCYHANKIAWLALESLCRQKNVDFEWELIVCEEEHEEMVGDWFLIEYVERLMAAGCKRIIYVHLDRWVLLAKKWQIIGKHISDTSKAFMLQAADCYSGASRLRMSYDKVVGEGVDWYDFKKGYFYSFISNRVILYDYDGQTNLCMCMGSEFARNIPNTTLERGIDYFLLKHCKAKKNDLVIVHDNTLIKDSLDTHGMNNISVQREQFFDSKPHIFHHVKKKLSTIIKDQSIYNKLLQVK